MSDREAWLVGSAALCFAVAFMPRDRSWGWRIAELIGGYVFLVTALSNT